MNPNGACRLLWCWSALLVLGGGGAAVVDAEAPAAIAAEKPPAALPAEPAGGTDEPRAAGEPGAWRGTHRYDPTIRANALTEASTPDDVLQMEPFVVHESQSQLRLQRYYRQQRERAAANKPGLGQGVRFSGPAAVGVMPYRDELPFGPPHARWSLIQLPW